MTEKDARDLFRAAYENRYTWDSNFPGYSADVTYQNGDQTYTATARIHADCTFEVSGIDDEDAKKAIEGQVWETAIHRVRRSFEETHGKNIFTLGDTDENGAVEVFVKGKSMGDRYKVRNNEVSLVHRHIRNVVVTIHTYSSHDTGSGYLSHRYDSVYSDPETGELKGGKSDFEDTYEKIGDYYVLTNRVIQTEDNGKISTQTFGFSNIAMLKPETVPA
ncbi:DUF3386 domain-containing protein [Myxacorys almedinensis]|uniref:DUF3386 family protein n=1 Tax=Myxacorys almedinensis A TaxID=2690445 RepID=A0A8J7YZA9_9CYAN|nr:DUF3386 domain-containing protein [Myxacorys almedinensis]NDJ16809.1 DUF3386 family protein [Myxacorys almedinensis A]